MKSLCLATLATMMLAGPALAQRPGTAPPVRYDFPCGRLMGGGIEEADLRVDPAYVRLGKQVCGDAKLRTLDAELAGLSARIVAETAGVDGETGRPIDHYGDEQQAWQRRTLGACRNRACMVDAYRHRIADVKVRWGEALE